MTSIETFGKNENSLLKRALICNFAGDFQIVKTEIPRQSYEESVVMNGYKIKNLLLAAMFPIIVLIFCACYLVSTNGMAKKILQYPYAIIGTIIVLTVWVIWDEAKILLLKFSNNIAVAPFESPKKLVQISIFMVGTLLYLILISVVGYFVITWLFCILLMYWLGERKLFRIFYIATGFIAFEYIIFRVLLYVPLPKGILI